MSQPQPSKIEVLVHISAPGTVRDDTTYRSHASACLAFEPVTRIGVVPEESYEGGIAVNIPPLSSARQEDADTTFGFGSFTSSWPSSAEAYGRGHQTSSDSGVIEDEVDGSSEACTPPSTVPDSQAESDRTDTPTPTPTPTPPLTWEIERNQSPDASPIKPIYISLSSSCEESSFRSLDPDTDANTDANTDAEAEEEEEETLRLPMEIHPPHPNPSSTARFETHLTPALRMLACHSKLCKRYAPAYQSRRLRPCERGYWFLHIPITGPGSAPGHEAWGMQRFRQFWGYLREYVSLGKAGWGVWCCADRADADGGYVDVRVCTWGEVVGAVYLVLYLASDRAVGRLEGVEWRDAGEKAVIRM
ncbi:hypothetical protein MferCBS31731_001957 [Microsporum ferrugineum]